MQALAERINHSLESVRVRALDSLLFKLENRLVLPRELPPSLVSGIIDSAPDCSKAQEIAKYIISVFFYILHYTLGEQYDVI